MTLSCTYDGAAVTHKFAPSGIEITHRADGESSFGGVPLEDPTGTLTIVGHRPFTVVESACAQPRLFTGFTTERGMGRDLDAGMFVGSAPRLVDVTIVDMNAALGFRQITGSDGNRPAETWAARLTWILGSDYLSEWISDDETWIVTNTTSIEATDYRGAYATAVLDDLVDRSGGAYVYNVFWDASASEVRLFFDNDSEDIGDCTLAISNVVADIDSSTTFAPDLVAKLAREPDQTYSDVTVTYDRGAKKLYRYRASTATTYVRRGAEISRPYTRGLATATAQAEKWLDKHSVETDRITCTIRVPAASVGLVQAGQSIQARFSHLGALYSVAGGATMRIVSCSPKPTDGTGYWYDLSLELIYRPAVAPPVGDCAMTIDEAVSAADLATTSPGIVPYAYPSISITPTPGASSIVFGAMMTAGGAATPWALDDGWTTLGSGEVQPGHEFLGTMYQSVSSPSGASTPSGTLTKGGYEWDAIPDYIMVAASIASASTTPVQSDYYPFQTSSNPKLTIAPPVLGNVLVMIACCRTTDFGPLVPSTGWTLIVKSPAPGPNSGYVAIWMRCADPDDGNEYGFAPVSYEYNVAVSEWEPGVLDDDIIDLGPTPGATTEHTTDPTVDDDETAGYTTGSTWINTTTGHAYILVDQTDGAAVWVSTTAISSFTFSTTDGTTTVDPTTSLTFVGVTLADLGGGDAEVTWSLPSGTPGGELGGTWASPTVDATHSGSAHLALGSTSSTAAAGDHAHAVTGVGEILISDTPSTPLVFADLLQNDDEDDLLYADI